VLTDNRLKIFVTLAESGSFTQAARRLGISQPAVSQCASQLEEEAGTPLLHRGRNSLTLTPTGERFLLYARRILSLYDSLGAEMSGAAPLPEQAELDLGDGRSAIVSAEEGNLKIKLK